MFPDPYKGAFPSDRVKKFEEKALSYIEGHQRAHHQNNRPGMPQHNEMSDTVNNELGQKEEAELDDFFGDDGEEVPEWVKNKHPELLKK